MTYVSENFWHDAVNKATTDLFTFGYKHIIKPHFIFNQTPDVAHSQMIDFCKVTRNMKSIRTRCSTVWPKCSTTPTRYWKPT